MSTECLHALPPPCRRTHACIACECNSTPYPHPVLIQGGPRWVHHGAHAGWPGARVVAPCLLARLPSPPALSYSKQHTDKRRTHTTHAEPGVRGCRHAASAAGVGGRERVRSLSGERKARPLPAAAEKHPYRSPAFPRTPTPTQPPSNHPTLRARLQRSKLVTPECPPLNISTAGRNGLALALVAHAFQTQVWCRCMLDCNRVVHCCCAGAWRCAVSSTFSLTQRPHALLCGAHILQGRASELATQKPHGTKVARTPSAAHTSTKSVSRSLTAGAPGGQ